MANTKTVETNAAEINIEKAKQSELKAYVTTEDYRRLEKEATNRDMSLSKTIRNCLVEYFALREELATAVEEPGELGEAQRNYWQRRVL